MSTRYKPDGGSRLERLGTLTYKGTREAVRVEGAHNTVWIAFDETTETMSYVALRVGDESTHTLDSETANRILNAHPAEATSLVTLDLAPGILREAALDE